MKGLNKIVSAYFVVFLQLTSITLLAQAPDPPSAFTAVTLSSSSIELSWQEPGGGPTPDNYLIVARKSGGNYPTVADGSTVSDDTDFTDPDENGAISISHTGGLQTYTWTSLDPETLYEFQVYSYVITGATPPYYSVSPPSTSARTFSIEPVSHAATFTASSASDSQIDLTFTSANTIGDADGYIILRRTGSAPTSTGVIDGVAPGSLSLPGGTTLVTTITNGATTSYSNSGLNSSTNYFYSLIPYNYNGSNNDTYNYKTNGTIPSDDATTDDAPPSITSLSPSGTTCVGETITISGTDFNSPTATINGVNATIVGTPTSTTIDIIAPGGAAIGSFAIVVTNGNGMNDSSSPYTIKPVINLAMAVSPSKSTPATNENFNILVGGATQANVTYRVRRIAPTAGVYSPSQNGNGGQLTFGPYSFSTPDTYVYEVQAQSVNCGSQTLTQTATVTIAALSANAGPATDEVCEGDGLVLGGSPSVSGGSGFYSITWTSSPPGFNSTASNPVATPTVTTTYTLTVEDSDGNTDTDNIIVTVNPRTDPADLNIVFTPNATSYSIEDNPVDLSYTNGGATTGTGTFSGTGVNSTTNKFYPNAANIGTNNITLSFVNSDNCETSIAETVNVYDPNGFITGLNPSYCPTGFDDLVVTIPPPYVTFVDIILYDPTFQIIPDGTSWTKNLATRAVHINLDQLPIGRNYFQITYTITGIIGYTYTPYLDLTCLCIQYTITPIFGPIQTYVYVPLLINQPPETRIAFKAKSPEFCRNDDAIFMEGGPIGGIWQGSGVTPAPGNDNNPAFNSGDNGVADFDPGIAGIGVNNIRYIYQDANGCRDTTQVAFTVYNIPNINFNVGNGCVGTPVEFDPTVTLPPAVNVSGYLWDFGDDKREGSILLNDPTLHTYTSSNDYDVTFSTFTDDGCSVSVTKPVSVGDIPDVKLNWANVCAGDPSRFAFQSNFFSSNPPDLNSIIWDFGDGNMTVDPTPTLADTIQFHNFAATGYYNAKVTIESDLGCSSTDSVQVYKVARTGIVTDQNEYLEDFNKVTFEEQQWKTGGLNSSWEWGNPANTLINDDASGGGQAWVTNLEGTFNVNEKSWVHSPCINLTAIQRPVLSLDIRSLTRSKIEGAVLQMNITNSTNNESDWETIGTVNNGVNWYDETGIFSNPGNQALNQVGWTGDNDTETWRSAIIALDTKLAAIPLVQRSRIRFRIAFASPTDSSFASNGEGFAFDNFKIGQRDRIVLLESFTNTGGENSGSEKNKLSNQDVNSFIQGATGEVVKLEYHIGLSGPNPDPIYLDNPEDANARSAYYGITSSPFVLMDGNYGSNLQEIFDSQTLKTAEATIDTILTTDTPAETFNIQVTFTAKDDLPPRTSLHTVVVEKLVDSPTAFGTNGETEFSYVMKKMLPSALGTLFTNGVLAGSSHTINVSWSPEAYNLNNLAVIAFLQNETTGEIYQARILETPLHIPDAGVITDVEPTLVEQSLVYPNPADQEVFVKLPLVTSEIIPLKLIDSFGREVYTGTIERGEQNHVIKTNNLAGGIYILQLNNREGGIAKKKVMIVHQ